MPDFDSDRRSASNWARNLLTNPDSFVIFDTETTGLPQDNPEIVQIGLLNGDGTVGMDCLVRSLKPIPVAATSIHKITFDMVADAAELMHILPEMAKIMHGKTVVVYNAAFDMEVLLNCLYRRECLSRSDLPDENREVMSSSVYLVNGFSGNWKKRGDLSVAGHYVDVEELYRPYWEARNNAYAWINKSTWECAMHPYSQWVGDWNDYHGSYRWQRLPGGDHTAIGDCHATYAVLQRMAEPDL